MAVDLKSLPSVIGRVLESKAKRLKTLCDEASTTRDKFPQRLDRLTALVDREGRRLLEPRGKQKGRLIQPGPVIPPKVDVGPAAAAAAANDEPPLFVQLIEPSRQQLIETYEKTIRDGAADDVKLLFPPGSNNQQIDPKLPPGSQFLGWMRLMSWNVHRHNNVHGQNAGVAAQKVIADTGPVSILAMQEAAEPSNQRSNGIDTLVEDPGGPLGLSRKDFVATDADATYGNRLDTRELKSPQRRIKLPPVQTLELGHERRALVQVYEVYQNDATRLVRLVVCNVHLDVADATGKRAQEEIIVLLDFLKTNFNPLRDWFIVMGDFNDVDRGTAPADVWARWKAYHTARKRWPLRRRNSPCRYMRESKLFVHASELDVTKSSRRPATTVWSGWPVDYIFVHTPQTAALNTGPDPLTLQIGSSGYRLVDPSDHLPVWVDVAVVALPRPREVKQQQSSSPVPQPQPPAEADRRRKAVQDMKDAKVVMADFYRVLYKVAAAGLRQPADGTNEDADMMRLIDTDRDNWEHQLIVPNQHWFWHRGRMANLLQASGLGDAWTPAAFILDWQTHKTADDEVLGLVRRIAACTTEDPAAFNAMLDHKLVTIPSGDNPQPSTALNDFQVNATFLPQATAWRIVAEVSTDWLQPLREANDAAMMLEP